MKGRKRRADSGFFGAPFFTPRGLLLRALLLGLVFLILHVAGLRRYTGVISGTAMMIAGSTRTALIAGACYILSYFAFVLLAPILGIAAGILFSLRLLAGRRAEAAPGDHGERGGR